MAWPTQNVAANRLIYFVCLLLIPFVSGFYNLSVGIVVAVVFGFYLLSRVMIRRDTHFIIGFVLLLVPAAIAFFVGRGFCLLTH